MFIGGLGAGGSLIGGSGTGTVDAVGAGSAGVDSAGGKGAAVAVGDDGSASDSAGHGRHSGTKCRPRALSMLPLDVLISTPSPNCPLEYVPVASWAVPLTDTVVRTEMTGRRPVSLTHGDHVTGLGVRVTEKVPFLREVAWMVALARCHAVTPRSIDIQSVMVRA